MKKKFKLKKSESKKILGLTLILFIGVAALVYWFFGLNHVYKAKNMIRSMDERGKEKALSRMITSEKMTKGILINFYGTENLKTIMVWNFDGYKVINALDNATYNSFSICKDRQWEKRDAKVGKNAKINYDTWRSLAKKGDYVEILHLDGKNVNDITVFDWWVFGSSLPFSYFELTCRNR